MRSPGRVGIIGVAICALALSCGKKKPEEAAPAPTGSGSAAAAAQVKKPEGASDHEYQVAWVVWAGSMPYKLMETKGFLAKRAAEHGIKVKLVEFVSTTDAVSAFSTGKLEGCSMTAMEALLPAAAGVESVVIVVNDTSDGGDGVLVRGINDLKGLKGKEILLAELSVSHYLLVRGLSSVGLKESDVKITNTDADAAGKAFITDPKVEAVTTWHPHLYQAVEAGKGKVIYSSKDIPGEIIDLLVVNGRALQETPQLGTVLTEAWYDAMRMIEDPATREEALSIMAAGAHSTVEDFKKMLGGMVLYTDRAKAAAFLQADSTKATMERVKQFSITHGLVKNANFTIGYGSKGNEPLRFDASYVSAK
jgi:NitT/TauT family transport system substrate-binding protein